MKRLGLLSFAVLLPFLIGAKWNTWQPASSTSLPSPILFCEFTNGSGATATSTTGPSFTLVNNPTWIAGPKGTDGALQFDGGAMSAYTASNVTYGTNVISVCISLWWDGYATTDNLAFESTANAASNDGAYFFDPNESAGLPVPLQRFAGKYNASSITRPSAAAWHRYVIIFDNRTSAANIAVYVDGSLVTDTPLSVGTTNPGDATNFTSDVLNLASRNHASNQAACRIAHFHIYPGALDAAQATLDYANNH